MTDMTDNEEAQVNTGIYNIRVERDVEIREVFSVRFDAGPHQDVLRFSGMGAVCSTYYEAMQHGAHMLSMHPELRRFQIDKYLELANREQGVAR